MQGISLGHGIIPVFVLFHQEREEGNQLFLCARDVFAPRQFLQLPNVELVLRLAANNLGLRLRKKFPVAHGR